MQKKEIKRKKPNTNNNSKTKKSVPNKNIKKLKKKKM